MKVHEETDYRLERKFFISGVSIKIIENHVRLHKAHFSPIYKPRWINNIYFDTCEFDNYFTSCEGVARRAKVRIRWYGELGGEIKQPVLELKIKNNWFVKKLLFPMVPFEIGQHLDVSHIEEALRKTEMPEVLKMNIMSLRPTLLNRYNRKYYQSFDKAYRLTLDEEMKFYRVLGRKNNLLFRMFDDISTVLELKYHPDDDDLAREITNSFPFRMTKSSKYLDGMVKLYE
jgi:SPX domain protein involved in polyphosphate accumulation